MCAVATVVALLLGVYFLGIEQAPATSSVLFYVAVGFPLAIAYWAYRMSSPSAKKHGGYESD